ncbi:MAG: hypothetical protein BJBARM5_0319 [Candidatus Parvarchaeum acidophilus ARMAN-5]|jgi:hypothetical protein|uniref:Uncharacterized protein n=1 Tax=Candidatus Parvarchaeum acidophilus ARMAN-5 TaxID=662762 RepID=D6GV18_PARA5|nr:MAG: hypothetical protein BJBARM5_0319 [Candidatus Parvarchaeum acidophilus ARMAN-5]
MEESKKCAVCGKSAAFYSTYLKQNLCKKHFERMLIRRVRSNMASNNIRGYSFRIGNENKCGEAFLEFLFKEYTKGKTLTLKSNTLEDFSIVVMRFFMFQDEPKLKISEKESFNPLFNVSEQEIVSFFSLKNKKVTLKKRSEKEKAVLDFLSKLEERRPGGMISIVKAGVALEII